MMVYAYNWTHHVALASLSQFIPAHLISDERNGDAFIVKAISAQPDLIILDLPPRNSVALILTLRKKCPHAVFLFTQNNFLFSDHIVAEYFQCISLKCYETLMSMTPSLLLSECRRLYRECQQNMPGMAYELRTWQNITVTLLAIKQLMYDRFAQRMTSPRAQEIVLGWLVKGYSPITIAQKLGCSSKVIYHYRLMAMKILGVRRRLQDFIASLEVTPGPISGYLLKQKSLNIRQTESLPTTGVISQTKELSS